MSHDDTPSNWSNNRPFFDVLSTYASRRQVLQGGMAAAATPFFSATAGAAPLASAAGSLRGSLLGFTPVAVADGNGPWPVISPDYSWAILIPWGEPIQPNGPAYNYPPNSADQALQIGIGHDGMTFFPLKGDPSVTNFPAEIDGVTVPRDTTFVITRKDGGIIGS